MSERGSGIPSGASSSGLADRSHIELETRWQRVESAARAGCLSDALDDDDLRTSIRGALRSSNKSYRYVLPTQILAKLVNPSLDSHAIQVQYSERSFDARSLCQMVIIPFDRANNKVLGGSTEPYANNPLRVPAVTDQFAGNHRNPSEWRRLAAILDRVESATPDEVSSIYDQVLVEIYRMLEETNVSYAAPARVSLETAVLLIDDFLKVRSGGDRLQAVVTALLSVVGRSFGLFDRIERQHINAADASSGQAADLECYSGESLVLVVEVKDRDLVFKDLDDKLPAVREKRAREFLALVTGTVPQDASTRGLVSAQFASGYNVYMFEIHAFAHPLLALLGEEGRVKFLEEVGAVLDRYSSIQHRRDWAGLLRKA